MGPGDRPAGAPSNISRGGATVADGSVSFGAGMTYGELAVALDEHGLALHNMASLPHISVGGAIATATHGSGDAHGNLATAVAALELVTLFLAAPRYERRDHFARLVERLDPRRAFRNAWLEEHVL